MLDRPCKLHVGALDKKGYGRKWYKGRVRQAHVVAVLQDGREVPDGLCVRHACDNRPCIEPTHLIVGTLQENSRDMTLRHPRWEKLKLTPEQVLAVRLALETMSQRAVAQQFNVSQSTIAKIATGRCWSYVA